MAWGRCSRACDTRLNRAVAVKILNEGATARFSREAHAIARLNHPYICTLYDVGPNYLVMELLEGEPLSARLRSGPLPFEQAIRFGVQVCDALAAAHANGVVHRDLKPANIIVSKGTAKVLDFGLAKMAENATNGAAATITGSNVIVGTPGYMAPEQVSGGETDERTDIFAFGLVFYEMLSGNRAFSSQSPPELTRAILNEQPAPLQNVLEPLTHVLDRCLAKDPADRWQTAHDVKLELEWAATPRSLATVAPHRQPWRLSWWLPLTAGLLLLSVATLLLWRRPKQELLTHTFTPFAMEAAEETDPAWSPDGRTITYAARIRGTRQIVTKALGSHNVVQITRGAQDCSNPFWSPDGRQIYYRIGVSLWAVGAAGGEPREVLQPIVQAASLSPAGTLAFIKGAGGNMSLWTAPASGTPQQHYRQAPFPDVFARVWSIDFSRDGSKLAMVMEREGDTGFVNELWVLPFPTGTPERIIAKVPFRISGANPGGHPNGRISWLPGHRHILLHAEMPDRAGIQLYLVDVERKAIDPLTSGVANARSASVSPDGDKVAFVSGGDDYDIVQVSIDGRTARPFLATATGSSIPRGRHQDASSPTSTREVADPRSG